jgi:hypothetical protein
VALLLVRERPRSHLSEVQPQVGARPDDRADLVQRPVPLECRGQVGRTVGVAQSRPGNEVGAWRDRGCGIELQERQVVDDRQQVGRPLHVQELGADRDAPGFSPIEPVDGHGARLAVRA